MEQLETEWVKYPVLRFDLSSAKGKSLDGIRANISHQLAMFESTYGVTQIEPELGNRLQILIQRANAQTGQKVVILIDEYDAPLLEVMHDDEKREEVRLLLREFYSPLKACDEYLRFVFITGISMFSQLSIFSELNNLEIISRNKEYASICGITLRELLDNFQYGIGRMAESLGYTPAEMVAKLKDTYDGYHFCADSEGLFNPFSLLNAFKSDEIGNYWFRSGTPTSLVNMLKKYKHEGKFKIEMLESPEPVSPAKFETPLEMQTGPMPLLYQAGYVTIKGYDRDSSLFFLGIPNSEVRIGLLQNLIPLYADVDSADIESITARASTALRKGEPDKAIELFQGMLASIPYMRGDKDMLCDAAKTEAHYHILFYFFFRMLHNEVYAEIRSCRGASDVVITTPKYIYIVEIKIDSDAKAALKQIEEKGYATPYLSDGREVIRLGINFSTATRTISEWLQS
jgi:hypothetical protein